MADQGRVGDRRPGVTVHPSGAVNQADGGGQAEVGGTATGKMFIMLFMYSKEISKVRIFNVYKPAEIASFL